MEMEIEILLVILVSVLGVISGVATAVIIASLKKRKEDEKVLVDMGYKLKRVTDKVNNFCETDDAMHRILIRYQQTIGRGLIQQGVNGSVKKDLKKLDEEIINIL